MAAAVYGKYMYDVCVCYDRHDGKAFANSICEPLVQGGSRVFRNNDQTEGKQNLVQTLEKVLPVSKMVIICLTKNYISSTWYLDELVMIVKSKMIYGHQLFLIYCDVERSVVQKQTTASSGEQKGHDRIEALREATNFAGSALPKQADSLYSRSISKIIELIQDKLKTVWSKVLPGTIKGFLVRAANIEKIEAAGVEVGLMKQEGNNIQAALESISNVTGVPLKDLEDMYAAKVLDLSNRNIESLPETISSLVELQQILLRDVELLMKLPPKIGALQNLKVLDLEGTELMCLPKEIGELLQLECLKVSLYRFADNYIDGIEATIPRGALSKLRRLKELSINVDPDCEWWDAEAKAIINELSELRNLKILKFYFPTDELLQQFLQLPSNMYRRLSNFRLIVGRHEPDIVFCLPTKLQNEFEKTEKLLKYVNGEGNMEGIGKALEHAKSLFLDRHWDIKRLSEFKIHEMHLLVCCLVVECNEMKTIIDGSDFYQEGDNNIDRKPVLELIHYLSVHHMKKLQCIWKGPIITGCLSSLEILVLDTCPELITIFNPELLHNLKKLKELIVKNCPKIESLVSVEPHPSRSDDDFLPNLQNILLVYLPGLLSISCGLIIRLNLQKIVVYNCPKLTPEAKYSEYIHEIKDQSQWSKVLDSSSNETDYLHHIFVDSMDRLKNSGNSPQAARIEGVVNVLKEDAIEQGVAPYQYGMDRPTNNASILSICGVAGIGKTTIAKSVYNSIYDKFEGSCFLSNICEYCRKPNGLVRLQAQLLSSILPKKKAQKTIYDVNKGILKIRNAIRDKSVLIVLDDVDDLSQLQALLGKRDWYCPGSKIIVTTKHPKLLTGYEIHKVYEVETLDEDESLRLFSLHAFGRNDPDIGYKDHSIKLVKHCCGLPLALVVLGSSLYGNSLSEYQRVNEKMKLIPQTQQLDSLLKASFYSLPDQYDKDLFLHIACFFIGKDIDYVAAILDRCGFQTGIGVETLANRCLLTIDRDNKLRMHQLLQYMIREIELREESPEKRRRVWQHEDALEVLGETTLKGQRTIEGLILDFPVGEEPSFTETNAFSKMDKLRLLRLNNVQLIGGYKEFPKDLVWLCWRGCPLSSLPTEFPMENVAVLDLRYSSLKQVWDITKFLPSLKILNLSHSHELTCTPNFSTLPKLESLILKDCINLCEVGESIAELERLCLLNLKGCRNLRKLSTRVFHLRSLEILVLSGCSELLKQPEVLESRNLRQNTIRNSTFPNKTLKFGSLLRA